MTDERKPRLFYWETAIEAWCPVPNDLDMQALIDVEDLDDGEMDEIRVKRFDMTEKEMDDLPQA